MVEAFFENRTGTATIKPEVFERNDSYYNVGFRLPSGNIDNFNITVKVDDGKGNTGKLFREVMYVDMDCNHLEPSKVRKILEDKLNVDVKDKIVMIKLYGILLSGRIIDIGMNSIIDKLYNMGAYFVMRNMSSLRTKQMEKINVSVVDKEKIEENIIKEHIGKVKSPFEDESDVVKQLMRVLYDEKNEGEKKASFEERVIENTDNILFK